MIKERQKKMKGFSFVLIASFLFLTSSCNSNQASDSLNLNKGTKQIVFFSDEEDYRYEASYCDAIIELKKEFPEEIDNMKVIPSSDAKKYYDAFDVERPPAILVVYGDRVIARVKGTVTKEQIIEPLTTVLQKGEITQ